MTLLLRWLKTERVHNQIHNKIHVRRKAKSVGSEVRLDTRGGGPGG